MSFYMAKAMLGCFDHAGFYLRKGRAATTEVLRGYVSFDMAGAVFCALPRMISQIFFYKSALRKCIGRVAEQERHKRLFSESTSPKCLTRLPLKSAPNTVKQAWRAPGKQPQESHIRLSLRRLSFNGPLRKCGTNALQKRPTRIAQECLLAKKSNKNVCQEFLLGASQILFQECLGMCFTRQKHLIPQHVFVMFQISASFHFEMFIGMYNVLLACNVNAGLRALQCSCLNAV